MAAISASQVKELRERTGLGMMECKKALTEADGDIEVAIENLRKSSGLKAAKSGSYRCRRCGCYSCSRRWQLRRNGRNQL